MTALKNTIALTLKLQLETAIYKMRQESLLESTMMLLGPVEVFEATSPDMTMEERSEETIRNSYAQRYNQTLRCYYNYGEKLYHQRQAAHWMNRTQTIAAFLYEYFKEEPTAIRFLSNVSPTQLNRLNAADKQTLIKERPPRIQPRQEAFQGLESSRADDLWHDNENDPISLSIRELEDGRWLEETSRPLKRARTTSQAPSDPETVTSQPRDPDQPPQEFRATESCWDDYFRNYLSESVEIADPSRKRKWTPSPEN